MYIKPNKNLESEFFKNIPGKSVIPQPVKCLIEEFFRKEREAGRNTSHCMISCPCPRCRPTCHAV